MIREKKKEIKKNVPTSFKEISRKERWVQSESHKDNRLGDSGSPERDRKGVMKRDRLRERSLRSREDDRTGI